MVLSETQRGMHELGHAVSIGWADDAPIPTIGGLVGEHAYEVYSGNLGHPEWAGGIDPTPENVSLPNPTPTPTYPWWSVMKRGEAFDSGRIGHPDQFPLLHFSIEELSTVDFEEIPSRNS
ncbi:hypothetical protein HLRTI_001736 [Halorhabdus tiamatea SARL4B]|uniref:Uncharacterized protein n=1 Tax=Halorhabdus tiamatea SARL4B TaxID=1033806 RepID=U2DK87_9EURY|nr:hypothetical protein [Halorhabdus tiamatea]ERJ06257.1 hypothetical protein HLRTI_001736 [Halorhabdus tiamatea SARL4B]